MQSVDHTRFINMEVKGVVRIGRIMRMTALGLFPADDRTYVFNDGLTLGNAGQRKDTFSVHTGAAGLDAARVAGRGFFGHG